MTIKVTFKIFHLSDHIYMKEIKSFQVPQGGKKVELNLT